MNTPICDFVKAYQESGAVRAHMPGHKGVPYLGCEALDITEIDGADVLYRSGGIIRQSEENAARLFGTARTVYSTEGSSLCIRAMLYLAMQKTGRNTFLAGRNVHATFVTACALLDADVVWDYHTADAEHLAQRLGEMVQKGEELPAAVYVTSPDYLGNLQRLTALSRQCRDCGVLLLVDNAHGAYLPFMPGEGNDPAVNLHPIALGADLCCDSAHKTLPVLTGGAYLHLSHQVADLAEEVEHAMNLFASTSPSYLILQSLDRANLYLEQEITERLKDARQRMQALKQALLRQGLETVGDEAMKLTIAPKSYGYTGTQVAEYLLEQGIVCEFADPDYVVLMLTPDNRPEDFDRVETALKSLPQRDAIPEKPPRLGVPQVRMSLRQALFAPAEVLPLEQCVGRVLASPTVSCPPAIPVLVGGEVVDDTAVAVFRYYGYDSLRVVKE